MLTKILVIDDDIALTKTLEQILQSEQYYPIVAHTAEDGLRLALHEKPDLILLDVMIPAMGGWEMCRRLRQKSNVPVIFLTALGTSNDVVHGLEIGADDYIIKPFEPPVILARIKAQIRRVNVNTDSPTQLSFGEGMIEIDLAGRTVSSEEKPIDLTRREFDLLATLAKNAGHVIPTAELAIQAWGPEYSTSSENIKPYIHYLRKKIEADPTSPYWIQTVRGIGYRFSPE